MKTHSLGWFATFAALVVTAYLAIHYFTGEDAVGAATRFVWNALAFAVNSFIRLFGGLAVVLAKGIGVRRVSRLAKLLTGVGLGYAGSIILSDNLIRNGAVLDPSGGDSAAQVIAEYNKQIASDPRLESVVLPIIRENTDGLGITIVR